MQINTKRNDSELNVEVIGRLDTTTAPQLEKELNGDALAGVSRLVLDFSGLDYISSAGLRVLLALQKTMMKQGEMIVKNISEAVMEVIEITGFSDILTIE